MAGGPIRLAGIPMTADKVFPYVHTANSRSIITNGVMASLDADATWEFYGPLPPTAPTGTLKLQIQSFADVAGTQSAYLRVLWAAVAAGENPFTITLNDEHSGGDLEIEHTTADDNEAVVTKVTLDADTITYGTDVGIKLQVNLKTASWDLAVNWGFLVDLIWE